MLGEIESAPRKCAPSPGKHLNSGSPSSARFTFPDDPRNLYRLTSSRNSPGNSLASRNFSNVRCGSTLDESRNRWLRKCNGRKSLGRSVAGSGGIIHKLDFTSRHIRLLILENSSHAAASTRECRLISRTVRPWSFIRHKYSPFSIGV